MPKQSAREEGCVGPISIEELFPNSQPLTPEQYARLLDLLSENLTKKFHVSRDEAQEYIRAYLDDYNRSTEDIERKRAKH